MSNPYFDRNPAFQAGGAGRASGGTQTLTPNGYPTMPGYEPGRTGQAGYHAGAPGSVYQTAPSAYGQQAYGQAGQVSPNQLAGLEQQYAAPSATNVDRGAMTYDDVIIRTVGLLAVIVVLGAVSWNLAVHPATTAAGLGLMMIGAVGALVLGLVNSFKREPSPALIIAYAACEGAMLGGFSGMMEMTFPGIVLQAVLGSVATFAVVLVAYKFAGFRVSGRAARILVTAMLGYLAFSLVNFLLMLLGVVDDPWGLRGVTIAGIPLGLIIGLLAVVMAAFSLAMDFESIEQGVRNALPRRYAWAGAFGLTVTLVWLYVEILRILAILRSDD